MIKTVFCGLLMTLVAAGGALARPIFNKPLYNEETKSYFELVDGSFVNNGQGPSWSEAQELAQKKYLGKTQGRLGIIPSAKTEMFIRLNLRPSVNMWFGLYYDCGSQTLNWVDGRKLRPGEYVNWAPSNWYIGHAGGFCNAPNGDPRMPALLAMSEAERNWVMQMPAKHYNIFLVEYPTGGPLKGEDGKASVETPGGAAAASESAKAKPAPVPAAAAATTPEAAPKAEAAPAATAPAATTPAAPAPAASAPAASSATGLPPGAGLPTYDPDAQE